MTQGDAAETGAGESQAKSAGPLPWRWQFYVAALLIVAFIVLTVCMLRWANATDDVWKNRVFVFSSVQSIVFTAVGWIFGREVNRAQVDSARKDADQARDEANKKSELADQKASEAADERAKGMRLAGAVETLGAGTAEPDGRGHDTGFQGDSAGFPAQLASLRDLARRLYD